MALIIKILLYPLSNVAERWQQEVNAIQAWLQPRLKNIKTNYSGEEAHQRPLALYQEKGISPLFVEVHRLAPFKSRGDDTSVMLDLMIHDIDIVLDFIYKLV